MVRIISTLIIGLVVFFLNVETSSAQKPSSRDYFKALSDIWSNVFLFDCTVQNDGYDQNLESLLTVALADIDKVNSQRAFCDLINQTILLPYGNGNIYAAYGAVEDSSFEGFLQPQKIDEHLWYWDTRRQAITRNYPITRLDSILQAIQKDTLIIDLRCNVQAGYNANYLLLDFFVQNQIMTSPETEIVHEGWNESFSVGYNYSKKWISTTGRVLYPINKQRYFGKSAANLRPFLGFVVALTNANTQKRLGPILDALQSQKNFRIMHEKKIPETVLADQTQYFDSVFVEYDFKSFYSRRGGLGSHADKELPSLDNWAANIKVIRNLDEEADDRSATIYPAPPSIAWDQFKDSLNREERLTGLVKVYSILRYFYPFFSENKVDLGGRLKQFFDRCYGESDMESYYQLLCEYVQPLRDSHITIWSHKRRKENGFTISSRFEKIDGRTIVVETKADSTSGEKAELAVGTEILKIGDKEIEEYESEWLKRIPASSPNAALRNLYSYIFPPMPLCGQKGSAVRLLVRRSKGESPIQLTMRRNTSVDVWYKNNRKPASLALGKGILYIDLSEVYSASDFKSCLDQVANSQSVILDFRRRPKWGSVKDILSPFYSGTVFMGWEEVPIVEAANSLDKSLQNQSWKKNDYWFVNESKTVCDKPLVILVNEYTQSGTEDLADSFRKTGRAVFVGSQTAATTGAATWIHIPNFGYCSFTGCRVKDPSGQLFYARGISPDIMVRPTAEGICTGIDEVLEAATKYLTGKSIK